MFDIFMEKVKRLFQSRLLPIVMIYLLLCFALVSRIFTIQIVDGEEHEVEAQQKITKERELKSTRGNILDRNGELLAYNEVSYSITYEDTGELTTNAEKNAMIYKLIRIIEKNDDVLAGDFFIQLDKDGNFTFQKDGSSELRFKRDVFSLSKVDQLTDEQKAMSAEEIFNYIRYGSEEKSTKMYDISDEYSTEDALKIMMIRFNILMNKYSRYLPITIATNVNDETVATVRESMEELPGVDVLSQTHRVYNKSEYFAHILGYTGLISQEKLEELKEEGNENYSATDQVGITGVEKEFEEYLHGENGSETVVVNDQTRVLEILNTNEPKAGNDVYLTIDAKLQETCYKLLERRLASIILNALKNNDKMTIYDVYYALINNSVIDITALNNDDSTNLEKQVYKLFASQQKVAFKNLKKELSISNTTPKKSLSDDMIEYMDYIYSMLKKQKILLISDIPDGDETLAAYKSGSISMSSFLKYAVSNNYVDLSKLNVSTEYYSTEELYEKLLDLIIDTLADDSSFNKIIYRDLVYSYKLSGKEICLLLFDQSVIEYDEKAIDGLVNGTLTPSSFIQAKIRNLEITPAQLALEPCSGSVVVTDVKTGELLALVTYPSYDNNMLANQVDSAYYAKLTNDLSYPLLNRPLQTRTAPGSTYKMVSSVAGLEEGVIGPTEKIQDKYEFTAIKPSPKDHTRNSHGKIDVPNALEVSCNYFYYELGYRLSLDSAKNYKSQLGLDKLKKYAEMFGFGENSGIELPEYEPQISNFDAVRSAIGQSENNYTPSQISRYVTAIANRGTVFNLTIFKEVQDLNKKVIEKNKATIFNNVEISNTTWNLVQEGMYKVVNGEDSSIKKLFKDIDVEIAGKTGTAQQDKKKPNHALFVSYAPFDDPEISVTVAIPNGYTSSNAAELARDVYKYYYKQDGYKDMLKGKVDLPELSSGISD
ncbi:penicillin-binding transpeptidase domain-containing protein [Anaerosporobacter faecicola]|uniref:penicillin-binding transpeptidase domain-containing protein n=1 Tax=Anaerosporobacter faecicola TaxID=2718714 RepID=UPI00143C3615|nr:penicillin-binding transpeptidase domain-containing protein [Anaerosporobacter faecicola]